MGKKFAGKYMLISVIVSDCGESRGVDVKGECSERLSFEQKAARKFCGDVLSICG